MSHTVTVKMIANQEIVIAGKYRNIHDISVIHVNGAGQIESCTFEQPSNQEIEHEQAKCKFDFPSCGYETDFCDQHCEGYVQKGEKK